MNIFKLDIIGDTSAKNGVLKLHGSNKLGNRKVKTIALHIKENKPGGTDIMTEFTPAGEEETASRGHLTCPDGNHPHMIDLGLPSGTLWSCCNVGAEAPEDYGDYYSWGEIQSKNIFNASTYEYSFIKEIIAGYYYDYIIYGYYDIGDDISGTEYDVAYKLWGESWRMPTQKQYKELIDNCTIETIQQESRYYYKLTGPNYGVIIIPAAGSYYESYFSEGFAYLWSSTRTFIGVESTAASSVIDYPWAYALYIDNPTSPTATIADSNYDLSYRYHGHSVRPVAAP